MVIQPLSEQTTVTLTDGTAVAVQPKPNPESGSALVHSEPKQNRETPKPSGPVREYGHYKNWEKMLDRKYGGTHRRKI